MTEIEHELRPPASDEEWRAFHDIRREVLFENRGKLEGYIENHPDDSKAGNHPLVLLYRGTVVGVVRVDIAGNVAGFGEWRSKKTYSDWAMVEFWFGWRRLSRAPKVVTRLGATRCRGDWFLWALRLCA